MCIHRMALTGCDLAFGRMAVRGGGVVINICSMAGLIGSDVKNFAAYHASKFGVLGLTKALGRDIKFKFALFNSARTSLCTLT